MSSINDLSGDALRHVASYLPKTSRILLGVALTAPPSSWRQLQERGTPNAASKAVLSSADSPIPVASVVEELEAEYTRIWGCSLSGHRKNELRNRIEQYYAGGWEILDFLDIEPGLASRLSDNDIFATVMCIDAKNTVKKLYLANCSGAPGIGWEILRILPALKDASLVSALFGTMFWISSGRGEGERGRTTW
ncbi:hypothetical protein ACHAXT_006885 [Thalassiosira profunda]